MLYVDAAWRTLARYARQNPHVASIVISTVLDYIREGYKVQAWCPWCCRCRDVDLEALVRRGLGAIPFSRLRRAFRCARCRRPGQFITRPNCRAYQQ